MKAQEAKLGHSVTSPLSWTWPPIRLLSVAPSSFPRTHDDTSARPHGRRRGHEQGQTEEGRRRGASCRCRCRCPPSRDPASRHPVRAAQAAWHPADCPCPRGLDHQWPLPARGGPARLASSAQLRRWSTDCPFASGPRPCPSDPARLPLGEPGLFLY